jgi:hypothetical protein
MELFPVVLEALENDATSGLDELQVSGGLAKGTSRVSTAVAVMVFAPVATLNVLPVSPSTWSRRYLTRQVVNGVAVLVTFETAANNSVIPGVFAVTWTSFGRSPGTLFTVSTPAVDVDQFMGPTVPVMS